LCNRIATPARVATIKRPTRRNPVTIFLTITPDPRELKLARAFDVLKAWEVV
jgi:hypothetical protein